VDDDNRVTTDKIKQHKNNFYKLSNHISMTWPPRR